VIAGILKKIFSDHPPQPINENSLFAPPTQAAGILFSFKKLWPFIKPNLRQGVLASATLLLASLLALPQPLFTKYIFDDVILQKNLTALAMIVGLLLAIQLLETALAFLRQFYFSLFEQEVIFSLQHRLIQRILRFPKSFFDNKQTGYLMSCVLADVHQLRMLFSSTIVEAVTNILKFIGGVVILFFLHWQLTLWSLAFLPFFYATVHFFGKKTRRFSHNMMEKVSHVSKNLHESISGVELIKAFGTEEKETQKLTKTLKDSFQASLEQNATTAFSQLAIGAIAAMGTLFVLWYGSREIIFGRLTIGSFMAFNAYLAYLYGPSRYLAGMHVNLQFGFAALKRVFALHDLIPEDEHDEEKVKTTRLRGEIAFQNITFAFDHQNPVLRDISLKITPGEKVALVGPSGAGKTTLANLILRFYKPQSGKILFDGVEADLLNLRSLRERMAIVSQEIFLFDDTIMNNIRYGFLEATDEMVINAAKIARAHEFISELPEGYQTRAGERGVKLSAGQKQRLSIARALIKNPDILIFDEPTSALDPLTEKALREALFDLTNGKTTIIIAHRLSTVTAADRILIMDKGRIIEEGTHEELIKQNGLYGKLYRSQS
jgi:ABC-type multidrug transport system fused ATPase/permease subunit